MHGGVNYDAKWKDGPKSHNGVMLFCSSLISPKYCRLFHTSLEQCFMNSYVHSLGVLLK